MVWPAIYVAAGLKKLWYCIFLTLLVEWIIIQVLLHLGWRKSLLISIVGNAASGLIGIYVMPFILLLWHLIADGILGGTFNLINWIATYILMCFGSVFIEICIVRLIWKIPIKKLFIPMAIGNISSYLLMIFLIFDHKLKI